jgi:hypothetical protein
MAVHVASQYAPAPIHSPRHSKQRSGGGGGSASARAHVQNFFEPAGCPPSLALLFISLCSVLITCCVDFCWSVQRTKRTRDRLLLPVAALCLPARPPLSPDLQRMQHSLQPLGPPLRPAFSVLRRCLHCRLCHCSPQPHLRLLPLPLTRVLQHVANLQCSRQSAKWCHRRSRRCVCALTTAPRLVQCWTASRRL